jgi:hypothetical protein
LAGIWPANLEGTKSGLPADLIGEPDSAIRRKGRMER